MTEVETLMTLPIRVPGAALALSPRQALTDAQLATHLDTGPDGPCVVVRSNPDAARVATTVFAEWLASTAAREVLIDHSRLDAGTCQCGWAAWGASHAEHVLERLIAALEAGTSG